MNFGFEILFGFGDFFLGLNRKNWVSAVKKTRINFDSTPPSMRVASRVSERSMGNGESTAAAHLAEHQKKVKAEFMKQGSTVVGFILVFPCLFNPIQNI